MRFDHNGGTYELLLKLKFSEKQEMTPCTGRCLLYDFRPVGNRKDKIFIYLFTRRFYILYKTECAFISAFTHVKSVLFCSC